MERDDIRARYERISHETEAQLSACKRRGRGFLLGAVATFVAAVAMVAVWTLAEGAWPLWGAAAFLLLYIMVRRMDVRNEQMANTLGDRLKVLRGELAYMDGRFDAFDDGARYTDASHPYTFDLDIFGPQSLFHRINRTVTTGGSDRLAAHLSHLDHNAERPKAVLDLSLHDEFLLAFKARGARRHTDTAQVAKTLHDADTLSVARRFTSVVTLALVGLSVAGLWVSIVLAAVGLTSGSVPVWWAVAEFFAMWGFCNQMLRRLARVVGALVEQVGALVDLVRLIDGEQFSATYACDLGKRLEGALDSFDALDGILQALDRRGNVLGWFTMNALFAADFFTLRKFWRWQCRYKNRFAEWVEAVSEMDALVSMATFARNEPSARWAEVNTDDHRVTFEAKALGHPFLGEKAVTNDVRLSDHHFYIVTGANMAGKSTFLRAVGISYVMAMAGLPVFAERLTVGRFALFTSMRTTDDLARGISYFNAELLRLRQLLESISTAGDAPTLIILDEILKGTNSLDKLNGSRLFLEHVAQKNVTGIVATHDLELSKMAERLPDRFHNLCFEIALGERVTYSYRIAEGVARNQNATFLLRQLLDGVDFGAQICPGAEKTLPLRQQ